METRLLPRNEWFKLDPTLLGSSWRSFPEGAAVLAVEQDDLVLACVALIPVWHLEGAWVHPDQRGKVGALRSLWKCLRNIFKESELREVWAMATTKEAAKLCQKVGTPVPLNCDHFAIQVMR